MELTIQEQVEMFVLRDLMVDLVKYPVGEAPVDRIVENLEALFGLQSDCKSSSALIAELIGKVVVICAIAVDKDTSELTDLLGNADLNIFINNINNNEGEK